MPVFVGWTPGSGQRFVTRRTSGGRIGPDCTGTTRASREYSGFSVGSLTRDEQVSIDIGKGNMEERRDSTRVSHGQQESTEGEPRIRNCRVARRRHLSTIAADVGTGSSTEAPGALFRLRVVGSSRSVSLDRAKG